LLADVWAASIRTISGYRFLAGEGEGSQLGEELKSEVVQGCV